MSTRRIKNLWGWRIGLHGNQNKNALEDRDREGYLGCPQHAGELIAWEVEAVWPEAISWLFRGARAATFVYSLDLAIYHNQGFIEIIDCRADVSRE